MALTIVVVNLINLINRMKSVLQTGPTNALSSFITRASGKALHACEGGHNAAPTSLGDGGPIMQSDRDTEGSPIAYGISARARSGKWYWRLCCATGLAIVILGPSSAIAGEAESQGRYPSFLSRVAIEVPLFTRHTPHDERFNDQNWSAFAEVALGHHMAVVAGDFINSYNRNTIFAGFSWLPINFEFSHVKIDAGGLIAADLNGGYRPFNDMHPFLGAFLIKLIGTRFEDKEFEILNRLGVGITIIPPNPSGGSTAINLALRYRLAS